MAMVSAILQIIAIVLKFILKRYDKPLTQEAMDEKFRNALARGDYNYAAWLLQQRVRHASDNPKG